MVDVKPLVFPDKTLLISMNEEGGIHFAENKFDVLL
jgi:hypothetical protein